MRNQLQVTLSKTVFSEDKVALERLNDIVAIHTTLSPGLLMGRTECQLVDALYILYILYYNNIADMFLLIYDNKHPDHLIQRRHISRGLPNLPLEYESDDGINVINNISELFYTIEFDVMGDVEVIFESDKNART